MLCPLLEYHFIIILITDFVFESSLLFCYYKRSAWVMIVYIYLIWNVVTNVELIAVVMEMTITITTEFLPRSRFRRHFFGRIGHSILNESITVIEGIQVFLSMS